jgi:hypothetical protein
MNFMLCGKPVFPRFTLQTSITLWPPYIYKITPTSILICKLVQETLENPLGIFLLFPCSKFNHFVNLPVVDKQFFLFAHSILSICILVSILYDIHDNKLHEKVSYIYSSFLSKATKYMTTFKEGGFLRLIKYT